MTDETLAELVSRCSRIEQSIVDFQRRSAHRETVIDRLHEENQQLRAGQRRDILEPVVVDLVRVYDGLLAQANRLIDDPDHAATGKMFASFADDVALALDRCGLDVFAAVVGEKFDSAVHSAAGTEPCEQPERHNTVAVPLSSGLRERESGRVRRPAKARFHHYRPAEPEDTGGPSDRER